MSAFLTIKLDALNKTYHSNYQYLTLLKLLLSQEKKLVFIIKQIKRNEMFISFHVNVTSCGRQKDNRNENENGTINYTYNL